MKTATVPVFVYDDFHKPADERTGIMANSAHAWLADDTCQHQMERLRNSIEWVEVADELLDLSDRELAKHFKLLFSKYGHILNHPIFTCQESIELGSLK
jgi:hypothetical protein